MSSWEAGESSVESGPVAYPELDWIRTAPAGALLLPKKSGAVQNTLIATDLMLGLWRLERGGDRSHALGKVDITANLQLIVTTEGRR